MQIMFDDHNRVACVHEAVDDLHEMTNIRHVQTCGRFIHDVDAALLVQLAGKFDALTFAARKRAQGLTKSKIIQAHIAHGL